MQQLLNGIRNILNGNVGINFHNHISTVLYYGFRDKNIQYVKTKQQGGDGGVDGYLANDDVYFAFSSDTLSDLDKVCDKIKSDLEKTINTVVSNKQYTGDIKKFIFVYNTHGQEKHNDRNGRIPEIINNLLNQNNVSFPWEIWNVDNVVDYVYENFSRNGIERIIDNLNISEYVKTPNFINDVRDILNQVEDFQLTECKTNWKRKLTQEKIENSGLEDIKDNINEILKEVEWYTKLENIVLDEFYKDKFDKLKGKIIELYNDSKQYGVDKLEEMIDKLHEILCNSSIQSCRLLIIYVLDKCDIF